METSFRLLCGFRSSASWIHITFICSMLCMWTCVESWSYFYSNSTMNWEDARRWCREHYTDMVAIQNREEIEHLKSSLPRQRYYYWIGIRKISNTWTWVGTSKVLTEEATNWATGEPNNGKTKGGSANSEDCVEMYIKREKEEGKWNDERCSKSKTALCYAAACKTDSCFHGECVETINSHKCDCFEGFYGDKCGEVVKCNKDEVTVPDQGHVYCTHKYGNFLYDSLCQYSCEEGYNLSMSRPLRCNASGKWSDMPPTCELVQCPKPSEPAKRSMKCSNPLGPFSYQSACAFTCDEGYVLSGSPSLQCEASGKWNASEPMCVAVQCPALQDLENGFVSCGEDADARFSYGNTCSFSCAPGYRMVGPSRVTCTSAATWSEQIPRCEAITCQNPETEAHLIARCSNSELRPNSTCSFSCEPDFELQGENTIKCSEDGQWNKAIPTCKAKGCPAPETPTNAQIRCRSSPGTSHPLGTVCSFSCDEGYELQGALSIECTNSGQWTSTPPTCTVVKCNKDEVTVPDQGHVNCTHEYGNFLYDSLCQYSCEEGYNLSMSRPLRCNASGKWSDVPPTCELVQCPKPSEPAKRSMKCSNPLGPFSYQSACAFTCDEGYVLSGSPSLQCEASGKWNASEPMCVAVQCPALQDLENGFVSCGEDADARFSYGNTCSFSCAPGYRMVGPSRVTCTSAATWSEQIPRCEAITCQNPETEAHLIARCSNSELQPNSTCSFSCEPDFELQGENTIKCSEDGQWNKAIPTCKAKECPAPETPTNAQIRCRSSPGTSHPLGMVCSFSCDEGYELQGALSIECTNSGQWTSTPPTCTVKRCPLLEAPENGHINCSDSSVYNSKCSFTCDPNYSLEGHGLLICDHHGNWTGEKPTCKASSPVTAVATSVATGGTLLSGLSLAAYILKKLKNKATKFELNSNSDIEPPSQTYKSSIDSLI